MFGIVLPRSFTAGRNDKELRERLSSTYAVTSMIGVPDIAFRYSETDTVLVIAHDRYGTDKRRRSAFISKSDYENFRLRGAFTWHSEGHKDNALWVPPL